jgi:hypothetical protein
MMRIKSICQNDLFLLLLEHLKKYNINNVELFEGLRMVKPDDRTPVEKLCDDFINEYFDMGDKNNRCKSSHVLEKLALWSEERKKLNNNAIVLSSKQLYTRLKDHQCIRHSSVRFSDNTITSGFYGLKIK